MTVKDIWPDTGRWKSSLSGYTGNESLNGTIDIEIAGEKVPLELWEGRSHSVDDWVSAMDYALLFMPKEDGWYVQAGKPEAKGLVYFHRKGANVEAFALDWADARCATSFFETENVQQLNSKCVLWGPRTCDLEEFLAAATAFVDSVGQQIMGVAPKAHEKWLVRRQEQRQAALETS